MDVRRVARWTCKVSRRRCQAPTDIPLGSCDLHRRHLRPQFPKLPHNIYDIYNTFESGHSHIHNACMYEFVLEAVLQCFYYIKNSGKLTSLGLPLCLPRRAQPAANRYHPTLLPVRSPTHTQSQATLRFSLYVPVPVAPQYNCLASPPTSPT